MSEKWHHSEVHIAINDESQSSIAKNLKCDELLSYTFIIHSAGERIFTARCYASAVLAMALCLSVRLSVTSRCSTKTAKRRITQTTTHDSPGTLVSCRQRSPRNSTGVTPYEGAECRWGGSKLATFDK